MHPTASIGPHEISGSRDWTGAVILLGTSCFNIQIVICHPTPCWDCFSCLPSPPSTLPPTTGQTACSMLFVLTSFNLFSSEFVS